MVPRRPWFYYAIAALGLVVYAWGFRAQMNLPTLPADFGPEIPGYPVLVDGIQAGSADEVRFLIQGYRPESTVGIGPAGNIEPVKLVEALSPRHLIITALSGLFFLGVSVLVFAPRAGDAAARDFFACTFIYGLAVMIGGVYFPGGAFEGAIELSILQMVCLAILPPIFLHLTLIFPRRSPLNRFPILPTLMAIAGVLVVWRSLAYLAYIRSPGPGLWRVYDLSQHLGDFMMVVEVAAGCVLLYQSSRRVESAREQRQARWLLLGFATGVTPFVFLRTLPGLWGLNSPVGPEFDRLFELAIPAAFVLAVVQHKLLDIDVIIRRSVIYAILTAGIVALYAIPGLWLGRRLAGSIPGLGHVIDLAILVAALLLFAPSRKIIGRWVDRVLFAIRYDQADALARLKETLQKASTPKELAEVLHHFLMESFDPKQSAVVLKRGSETLLVGDLNGLDPDRCLDLAAGSVMPPVLARRGSTGVPEVESRSFPAELPPRGFWLLVPLKADAACPGFLLLGEKRSERRYVEVDLSLLEMAAADAAMTLERMYFAQTAAEEALERRRLGEINRLKSEFLSMVAHDLRTPLASISWSADNLIDGVAGPLHPPQSEYVQAIKASAAQLDRLVGNLLSLSRLELSSETFSGPVDVSIVLDEAIAGMKPLAARKDVRFEVNLDTGSALICGSSDKLLQIWINLLDNAIKYSPPGGVVDIRSAADGPDACRIIVRDRGPGIPAADLNRIFEKFTQGSPSPYSPQNGFGLGLNVVKSCVEQMNGIVTASNVPDGGAEFMCRLPAWLEEMEVP